MKFHLFKIAFKDMSRRKWDFFRLSIILSLGFSALYTTLSLKGQLISKIEDQAKYILTSDLSISVRRAITDQELSDFNNIIKTHLHEQTKEITLLTVMSSQNIANKFLPTAVNVKWVDHKYPFYSKSKFLHQQNSEIAWEKLHQSDIAYINKDQAQRLDLKINDEILIFGKYFKIADLIDDDSNIGVRFFSLFPIVFISLNNVPEKNIFGTQTSFFESRHIKWKEELTFNQQQIIKKEIESKLTDPALKVNLPKDSSEQNQRLWDTISDFLGILTLCSLILCVLGLVTLMRYQWSHEIITHKRFYMMGLSVCERFYFKFMQTNMLALLSILLCLVISFPIAHGLSQYLPAEMNASMRFFHFESFLILGLSLLTVLNLISTYFFFLEKITPQLVSYKRSKKWKTFCYSLVGIALSLLIGRYLTRSWFIAITVILTLLGLYLILIGLIRLIILLSNRFFDLPGKIPLNSSWQIITRLIFRSWQKNLSLYSMTVSCLGVVYFLLILLMTLQVSMKTQLTFNSDKPDMFLIDVQPEDTANLESSLGQYNAKSLALSPMIRGRLLSINDKEIVREEIKKNLTREEDEQSRFKFRAVSVSYKKQISSFERIVKGEVLPSNWIADSKDIPISLEFRYAKRLKVDIGDRLTFEFQGQKFNTVIKNLRYVFWLSLYPNFFILFPDGVLNHLPQTYLSVLKFDNDSMMKNFAHNIQQEFNHISILLLKQTAELVWKQVSLLLNAFLLISSLFLILGVFLWLSVIFERLSMEKTTTMLYTKIGMSSKSIGSIFLGEFMGMLLIIFLITPILSYFAAKLIANEYFDGLLVWPGTDILLLSIILVLPLGIITQYLVGRFSRIRS